MTCMYCGASRTSTGHHAPEGTCRIPKQQTRSMFIVSSKLLIHRLRFLISVGVPRLSPPTRRSWHGLDMPLQSFKPIFVCWKRPPMLRMPKMFQAWHLASVSFTRVPNHVHHNSDALMTNDTLFSSFGDCGEILRRCFNFSQAASMPLCDDTTSCFNPLAKTSPCAESFRTARIGPSWSLPWPTTNPECEFHPDLPTSLSWHPNNFKHHGTQSDLLSIDRRLVRCVCRSTTHDSCVAIAAWPILAAIPFLIRRFEQIPRPPLPPKIIAFWI